MSGLTLVGAVAAGGAVGAVARYGVGIAATRLFGHGFPWGTFIVNVAGSFILGALITFMALRWSAGQEMRAFLAVGVMGAFTTFSTFSMDVVTLADRGAWGAAAAYLFASVALAIAGFLAGMAFVRWVA
jgi:CrcB protein